MNMLKCREKQEDVTNIRKKDTFIYKSQLAPILVEHFIWVRYYLYIIIL